MVDPDPANGLDHVSAAQCQHLRSASPHRIVARRGNVGPVAVAQIRQTIATLLDLPG